MPFVKGNDGRATRRARDLQNVNKLKTVTVVITVYVLVMTVFRMDPRVYLKDMVKGKRGRLGSKENWAPSSLIVSAKDSKRIAPILDGSVHLINIHVAKLITKRSSPDYYDGIEAEFCNLDWKMYKMSPWKLPMYRDLMNASDDCRSGRIVVNLKTLMEEVYEHDKHTSSTSKIKSLKPNFIFHESRCGSTLLANAISYADPKENRVYSEAGPALSALRICGEHYDHCTKEVAQSVFRDVIYLMGRVPPKDESRLFFKMQSIATNNLEIVHESFPDAPWVFLYRDPEEVLVSHLNIPHQKRAKCLQSRRHPPHRMMDVMEKSHLTVDDLSNEEFCAIYLSAICQSAIDAMNFEGSKGKVLNYENILDKFSYDMFPNHFGVSLGPEQRRRMEFTGTMYSKSRDQDEYSSPWSEDSAVKHDAVTDAIQKASNDYLAFSYTQLEGLKS